MASDGETRIMFTSSAKLIFHIPYAMSLKDKRQVRRSIIDKARNKFNASIAEVDTQDMWKTLSVGVAVVSGSVSHAQELMDEIIRFMEDNSEAELIGIEIA